MEGPKHKPGGGATSRRRWLGLAVLAWVGVALALGAAFPNPTPHYDEYYHLLAARSLLHEGDLTIMDGAAPYERAWLFTYAVAGAQHIFGETLSAARLPATLSFALLVAGLFLWVQRRVHTAAACAAAGLLLLTLHPLNQAATVRFYGPHAAAVFLATVAGFEVVRIWRRRGIGDRRGWVAWAALAAGAWALALHFQTITVVPGFAFALWLLPGGVAAWWRLPAPRRRGAVVAALLLSCGAVVAVFALGLPSRVLAAYHTPQLWAEATAHDWAFYHRWLAMWYGPLWWGVPLWAALGWRRQRHATTLALVMLLLPVVVHSFVTTKADRYVFYTLPWLFVLTGIGLAEGLDLLRRSTLAVMEVGAGLDRAGRQAVAAALAIVLVPAVGYGAWRVPGVTRAIHMAGGDTRHNPFQRSDWSAAAPLLRPRAQDADVVVTSAGLRSLYYLGRLDAGLSVHGAAQQRVIGDNMSLRAPALTEPEQLEALRRTYGRGLIIVEHDHWRQPAFVTNAEADWLETSLTELPTPGDWRLRVFTWAPAARIVDRDPDDLKAATAGPTETTESANLPTVATNPDPSHARSAVPTGPR